MKFVFCLLLLMVNELSIADKEAKAEKTESVAQGAKELIKGIWTKMSSCSKPKVKDDEISPFHDLFESLETGLQTSVTFDLENEILEIQCVRDLFTSEALQNSELRTNFNIIIGIQVAIWGKLQSSPRLGEALQNAMKRWREHYLRLILGKVNQEEIALLAKKGELKNQGNVYMEIVKYVSNEMKPKLTNVERSVLREVLQLKIALELLLRVVPEKQVAMFVLLLKYYEGGDLNKFQEDANKRMRTKKAENSEPQSSIPSRDSIFWFFDVGQKLSEDLKLMEMALKTKEIKELNINLNTLNNNPRLRWCLESLIGTEASMRYYFYIMDTDIQKQVFKSAVGIGKNHFLDLSSTDGKTHEQLMKAQGSTKPLIEDIIEKAIENKREVVGLFRRNVLPKVSPSQKDNMLCYLRLKMVEYVMLSLVPKNEVDLLKIVFEYFEDGKMMDIFYVLKEKHISCNL